MNILTMTSPIDLGGIWHTKQPHDRLFLQLRGQENDKLIQALEGDVPPCDIGDEGLFPSTSNRLSVGSV